MQKVLLPMSILILILIPLLSQGQDSDITTCTDSELVLLNDIIVPEYNDLMIIASTVETSDDLIDYINAQLDWRDNTLSQLPTCAEAIELGSLMSTLSSDISTLHALEFAGVSGDENPLEARINDDMQRFNELAGNEVTIETEPAITKTYYVTSSGSVNIRSCGSTDCGVVATANRGDALTVIDDSGSWYELQLDNGGTGFIADFLVSANPPSTQPTVAPVQQNIQPTAIPVQQEQVVQPTTIPVQPTAIPAQPTAVPVQPTEVPVSTVAVQSEAVLPAFSCDCSKTCGAMASCDEAYFQLNDCGCGRRDGDGDGVPCESICPGG